MLSSVCGHALMQALLTTSEQCVAETRAAGREGGGGCLPMPGQRRLAISRSRVPDLDGFVTTAAGNLLSIGAPRHREDTVFVRSQ